MGKHLVDIDEAALAAAQAELGTASMKDTVNEALRRATVRRSARVRKALDRLGERRLPPVRKRGANPSPGYERGQPPGSGGGSSRRGSASAHGPAGRAGITDLEVGYGSRNAHEWDQDMADLSVFELVETTADHVRRARQVQSLLASRSQRGRNIPHLLIARLPRRRDSRCFNDNDFELIARMTGQLCQWVVPAGTID